MLLQGYAFVPQGDDEALKEAVYSRGPLAVSLDAGHPSFRFYSHGRCAAAPYTSTELYFGLLSWGLLTFLQRVCVGALSFAAMLWPCLAIAGGTAPVAACWVWLFFEGPALLLHLVLLCGCSLQL